MKKLTSLALSLAILASTAVPAAAATPGQVVDYALHTDIVAQIDGHPLRSYNVGGRTAIVAEDLVGYGFQVAWHSDQRMLNIYRTVDVNNIAVNPSVYPDYQPGGATGVIGTRAEAILSTDIRTRVENKEVDSFNINGKTLIWLSDLQTYGKLVWDESARTANLVKDAPRAEEIKDELTVWSAACGAEDVDAFDKTLAMEVTVTRWAGENDVVVTECNLPYDFIDVEFSQSGVYLIPGMSEGGLDFEDYPFGKACRTLARSTIPSVFREGDYYFTTKNPLAMRRYVSQYFQVTYNGKLVPGDLWWTGRNGSRVLRFDFDTNLAMKAGDVLQVWVGTDR